MMRWTIVLPGLLAAMPAQAQDMPDWLLGEWCPDRGPDPASPQNPSDPWTIPSGTFVSPWLGPQCFAWVRTPGGYAAEMHFAYSGRNDTIEYAAIDVARGHLRYSWRVSYDRLPPRRTLRYRLVSHGQNRLVFERRGGARLTLSRDGGALTLDGPEGLANGRYVLARKR